MPHIFINYRIREQAGYAALLDRELTARFGRHAVFRAPRSIVPGDDFARQIIDTLRGCVALLAVIGPGWASIGGHERRPVGGEADWVRREIAEALARRIRVIPVLVDDAEMPAELELPSDIATVSRCQYLRLSDHSIEEDIEHIVREVGKLLPQLPDRARPGELPQSEGYLFRLTAPGVATTRIGILTGTILRVHRARIWVNSENTDMEMSRTTDFSISGIIRYWGAARDAAGRVLSDVIADELRAAVAGRTPVAPGSVFVTGSGALHDSNGVQHVIHVAAVHGEPGSGFRPVRRLGLCVTNVLAAAETLATGAQRARTILLPLLGSGVGGADAVGTTHTVLDAVLAHLTAVPRTGLSIIYLLAYTDVELAALRQAIGASTALEAVTTGQADDHH